MKYLARRCALFVPTLLLVLCLVFLLVRLIPGDVVTLLLNDQNVSADQAAQLRSKLGLNDSLPVQFVHYIADVARGDFGNSIWTGNSVWSDIVHRLPVTAELALLAALFTLLIGVPLGVISAIYQDRPIDYGLRVTAIAGLSLPGFWLGTLAIAMPAVWWHYSPPLTYVSPFENPGDNARQFLVPAFIMSLYFACILMRMTRSAVLEVLREDYVRTARSKGLRESIVIRRHVIRNGLIPVVTLFGTQVAVLLGGTVIFEQIFNLQGIGSYVFQAVSQRDYPAIQSVNILLALAVLIVNLAVDCSYVFLDPRTQG